MFEVLVFCFSSYSFLLIFINGYGNIMRYYIKFSSFRDCFFCIILINFLGFLGCKI